MNFASVCVCKHVCDRERSKKQAHKCIYFLLLMPFADCGAATGSAQSATSR